MGPSTAARNEKKAGLWFKFVAENVPFMILPFFVLYAIYFQIDHLTRRAGATAVTIADDACT